MKKLRINNLIGHYKARVRSNYRWVGKEIPKSFRKGKKHLGLKKPNYEI